MYYVCLGFTLFSLVGGFSFSTAYPSSPPPPPPPPPSPLPPPSCRSPPVMFYNFFCFINHYAHHPLRKPTATPTTDRYAFQPLRRPTDTQTNHHPMAW